MQPPVVAHPAPFPFRPPFGGRLCCASDHLSFPDCCFVMVAERKALVVVTALPSLPRFRTTFRYTLMVSAIFFAGFSVCVFFSLYFFFRYAARHSPFGHDWRFGKFSRRMSTRAPSPSASQLPTPATTWSVLFSWGVWGLGGVEVISRFFFLSSP